MDPYRSDLPMGILSCAKNVCSGLDPQVTLRPQGLSLSDTKSINNTEQVALSESYLRPQNHKLTS